MSWWPYIVLLVATRCLYWRYLWLCTVFSIACFRMSRWPDVVLLLATRCLYWRVCPTVYCILNCMLQNVTMTLHSTACGHQMPLLGVCLTEYQPDPKAHQMWSWPDVVLVLATWCLYWGGVKTIKMAWDLCSSPPCIPFYPYTMFQNPMPKPFNQKSRKAIITQKVLVTQSCNIVHCIWHT